MAKIISQFGHNVWESRLVTILTVSAVIVLGQKTEMQQKKKPSPFLYY